MFALPLASVTLPIISSHFQEWAGECRNRSSSMKSAEDFWSKKKFSDPTTAAAAMAEEEDRQVDQWLLGRQQRMGELSGGGEHGARSHARGQTEEEPHRFRYHFVLLRRN